MVYEVMCCFKVVLNNTIGMNGFVSTPGAVQAVAWCLSFERKSLSLLVLEILSVLCYFSETSASLVASGMRQLARKDDEVMFYDINRALLQQDVEVKAAIMQFINRLLFFCSNCISCNCLLFKHDYGG
jgi:hypothetical protein